MVKLDFQMGDHPCPFAVISWAYQNHDVDRNIPDVAFRRGGHASSARLYPLVRFEYPRIQKAKNTEEPTLHHAQARHDCTLSMTFWVCRGDT